ncbi:MAG: carboxypeptidase regulatory-like domain-containing protein [Proteobacteria bacterium]|nr:carboxypeptidase regulatory-like domain-containing protein [Pseudomonadota bacterium]MBI3496629.1 carboxypeptidase regulatory-like domain-containing protein [Pseudomonadota bacterium]
MLIGYVSDERYVGLPDVQLEFLSGAGSIAARSRASGAVHAELAPGPCTVVLNKAGYGAKRVDITVKAGEPYQFRLLSDCLLGYAWPKAVQHGNSSEFRVHSPEAYELELWRYGWKKELVRRLGWHDEHGPRATVQITPDGDYSQTGVQWNKFGYASPAHKQWVSAPERSGLYYFHARTKSGLFFSFPWVVAPKVPQAPIAVLACDINWNAYNPFGGRSNYINPDRLPPTPTVNARQELARYTDPDHMAYTSLDYAPLSFERPEPINLVPADEAVTNPIEGRTACHLAPAEWRLLGWMEREGFDYDLWAETQFHHGIVDLDRYRVLVLSTHPEYWSREMYWRVKRWVFERGGRLLYLGGNGLNCEAEFVGENAVIYQNGNERERLHRGDTESRFHARVESEANLLGVVFSYAGIMTSAPYRVLDEAHWVFAGTGLQAGQSFGEASLHRRVPGGASGHETDKISKHAPKGVQVLAKGLNPEGGGADMVIHETASGGRVFSVGSITWPSSILVDDAVSRITANVLRNFLDRKG